MWAFILWLVGWQSFTRVEGRRVTGDKEQWGLVSQTLLFREIEKAIALHLWWDEVALFEVDYDGPYWVGYTDAFGETRLRRNPVTTRRFAGALGYEDCEFFAIRNPKDPKSRLEVKFISRRSRKDPGDHVTVI